MVPKNWASQSMTTLTSRHIARRINNRLRNAPFAIMRFYRLMHLFGVVGQHESVLHKIWRTL